MLAPRILIEGGVGSECRPGALRGRRAIERAVDTMRIVIISEFAQLAHQVYGVPEECPIKVLTPNSSDQPFDERMRDRSVRNRLDLLDPENAQVGEPAVESEQRVVVGTGVPWQTLARAGAIEHPAYRDAIDAGGFDAEADNAAGENIHDQHPNGCVGELIRSGRDRCSRGYPWRGR